MVWRTNGMFEEERPCTAQGNICPNPAAISSVNAGVFAYAASVTGIAELIPSGPQENELRIASGKIAAAMPLSA